MTQMTLCIILSTIFFFILDVTLFLRAGVTIATIISWLGIIFLVFEGCYSLAGWVLA